MNPAIFGPSLWYILHTMAAHYPIAPTYAEQTEMKYYLIGLPASLPCEICKEHLREWLATHSIDSAIQNRKSLFNYIFEMHNNVNKRLGKKQYSYNVAAASYNIY